MSLISLGLVLSGANFYILALTNWRLPNFGSESEDHVIFTSSSCYLHAIFICFVPNTGTCLVIFGVFVGMQERQVSAIPARGIRIMKSWTVSIVRYFEFMHKNNRALIYKCIRLQVVKYARYTQSTPTNAAYQDNP